MKTPGSLYHPSPRASPRLVLREPRYPGEWATRMAPGAGQIKWAGRDVRVGQRAGGPTRGA